jgi:large subunit ribosomal protein L3
MKFILGEKLGMSQMFDEQGNIIPVTIIKAGPCFVTQIRDEKKDNYEAIQIGFKPLKDKKVKNPQKNKPYRYLKEFSNDISKYKIGDKIDVNIFEEGDKIKVSGTSKGKGFQGVVKRHGFSGGPATHGHRHVLRTPGSIGSAYPQKVFKGKKMPGRAGGRRTTIKNLKIAVIDKENNLLAIDGAVSGPVGGLVEISSI